MQKQMYRSQVQLLLRTLPQFNRVNKDEHSEPLFALKGGTALNLFHHDMPRLSVDIDLTYLPIQDRNTSLWGISEALSNLSNQISKVMPRVTVHKKVTQNKKRIQKISIQSPDAFIKIEPNEIVRGTLYPVTNRSLSKVAADDFGTEFSTTVCHEGDLYGGKFCAALDRQHPRDLFDVKVFFEKYSFTDVIRKGVVVYLASHNRPMNELLNPTRLDIKEVFKSQFQGMTRIPIDLSELLHARDQLIHTILSSLTASEREFLVSIALGEPNWAKLNGPSHAENLPALQWRILNVRRMSSKKRTASADKLKEVLEL